MGDRGNSEAQEKRMLEKSHLLSLSLSQGYRYATWCYSSRGLRSRHLEWTCIIGTYVTMSYMTTYTDLVPSHPNITIL